MINPIAVFKDFCRRLLFSRSSAYFILSFLFTCSQVILRASLYTVDNAGSHQTALYFNLSFSVFLSPSPNGTLVGSGLGPNASFVIPVFALRTDEFTEVSQSNQTLFPDKLLWALLPNGDFEFCENLPGPCWKFTPAGIPESNNGTVVSSIRPFIAAYTANLFRDNRTEDVIFVVVHVYLLALTFYTLARESIPHLIVIFAIRLLSTAWSIGRLIESALVRKELTRLGISAGSDQAFGEMLDTFWHPRQIMEGCLLGASILFSGAEVFAAYRLGQIYSQRPWRVVQVSKEMRHMYRLVLGFSVLVQMSFLLLPVASAMWVDQLLTTWVNEIAEHRTLYLVLFVSTTVALPLWVVLGWYAIRSERRVLTTLFLAFGFALLGCWAAMFYSSLYRWTFMTWWFFGTLSSGALAFLTATLVMGIVCRRNFGKNLDHYLRVQTALSSSGFTHGHFEKCQKLDNAPIPEYPDEADWKGVKDATQWSHSSKESLYSNGSMYSEESDEPEYGHLEYDDIPLT